MKKEERKNRFLRIMNEADNNPDIISGIYNYCDRWCERCKFIKRCRVGLMELESLDDDDTDGSGIWDELSAIFETTFEMIIQKADELGIDLNDAPEIEIKKRKNSHLEKIASNYAHNVYKWLSENKTMFDEKVMKVVETELAVPDYKDALDIIVWYESLILVKIKTAKSTLLKVDEFDETYEYLKEHSNGLAKISLIAIDRSIEAFTLLFYHFPQFEDRILGFLKQLSEIKKTLLVEFPGPRFYTTGV